MVDLDWIWERRNRGVVLLASALIVIAIAVVDWWTKPYFSLGFLYLFPIMLAAGFLQEVRLLWSRGDLSADLPALRAVGYRQLWSHLAGELSLEQATQRGIAATRQLAKRQLTWIRSERSLQWLDPDTAGAEASWNRDVVSTLRELGL